MTLSDFLKTLSRSYDLSDRQLALALGFSLRSYQAYKHGYRLPPRDTARSLFHRAMILISDLSAYFQTESLPLDIMDMHTDAVLFGPTYVPFDDYRQDSSRWNTVYTGSWSDLPDLPEAVFSNGKKKLVPGDIVPFPEVDTTYDGLFFGDDPVTLDDDGFPIF